MKEASLIIDIKNREEQNFDKFINFSLRSSYKELKKINLININIIKSKISIFEYFQPYKYLSLHNIGLIDEIHKKYKDYPEYLINNLNNIPKEPEPLFNINSENAFNFNVTNNSLSDLFNNLLINHNKISYIHDLNQNINKINFISKKNHLTILNDNDKNIKTSNKNLVIKKIFLKQKRKRYIFSSKKEYKKSLTKLSNEKKKKKRNVTLNGKQMNNIKDEFDNMNKKVIFNLSKNEKSKKRVKEVNNCFFNKIKRKTGRKKKNSGEIGFHNKFSKDNMMRKLKNKVIESARKLLNKIIKSEAGKDYYKNYKEIHKIEGIYSQDLSINYNIWFYFQKLKDIFQFKMSSKYSKNNLKLNKTIIDNIYSEDNRNKFTKTIKLLEMEFHQFYHYIFLGEEKNWYTNLNITEKDNIFQLEYFLNKKISKSDKDYLIYKRDITNLAYKYELFFLTKNPRLKIENNKKTDESNSKKLIKNITNEQFDIFKKKFVTTGMNYLSNMTYTYRNYLNNDLTNLSETFLPFIKSNSNNGTKNEENVPNKLSLKITDNTNKFYQGNIIKNNNNNINNNNSFVNNKHVLFDVSKKLIFKTNRKTPNKNNNKKNFKLSLKKNKSESQVLSYIFKINNTKTDDLKQKIDKETETNNIIQEESSQNLTILI